MAAWVEYFHEHYPNFPIVQVEAYIKKDAKDEHQGKSQYEPHLSQSVREQLVEAIRKVHLEMLQPPDKVKNKPAKLHNWKPPVKQQIDWARLLNTGDSTLEGNAFTSGDSMEGSTETHAETKEPEFLTLGLIGRVYLFMLPYTT